MKAAVVTAPNQTPIYSDFTGPTQQPGCELITVHAAALTHLTKGRASGAHYSAEGTFPLVPGVDGVGLTSDGRRVYFVLPEAPFGAMAETVLVRSERCLPLPPGLDDVAAAALANPGMSAWAALGERAQLKPGETVLINGATGSAGHLAVQIAKYMGAGKIIVTGRNEQALEALKPLGADIAIPFKLDPAHPDGANDFETILKQHFATGIDIVVDYLWGPSAETVVTAIVKAVETATPVRFIQVGAMTGDEVRLSGSALRSSSIVLMGSGLKSVPMPRLLASIASVFAAAIPANLRIETKTIPLSQVESTWNNEDKSRLVYVIG